MRVAIIGVGPKGLYALERLLDHAATLGPGDRLRVDLFEPHPSPGAGPNYDPRQPDYLIMNFAASQICMWWPSSQAVQQAERMPFVEWASRANLSISGDSYPPRALVGRYLTSGFETLLRHSPEAVDVRLRTCQVERVRRRGSLWEPIVRGEPAGVYDEVLITTGHVQGSPYPVAKWLSRDRIAPGATVAVRGFALTFIDVALALTEGRGGSFSPLDHPFRLQYAAPIDPVGTILPFSRTGRPMLAKSQPTTASVAGELNRISEQGRLELTGIVGDAELTADVLPIIARAVNGSLAAVGVRDRADPDSWLAAAAAGSPLASTLSAYSEIEHSLAIATGLASPDLSWALGHTWRTLYPATVARLSGDGLVEGDWAAFLRLSSELERVAFGPPAINAAKLLALIDAGVVDVSHVASGEPRADLLVDAVLPGPGVPTASSTVAAFLVADGHARLAPFRRGIDVDCDGSCRATDGGLVPGLAAIGRPTEDSVIGNDTLARTLHPTADRWARRIVDQYRITVAA